MNDALLTLTVVGGFTSCVTQLCSMTEFAQHIIRFNLFRRVEHLMDRSGHLTQLYGKLVIYFYEIPIKSIKIP